MNNYYEPFQNGFNQNFYQPDGSNLYRTGAALTYQNPINQTNLYRSIPNIQPTMPTRGPSLLRSLFGSSSRSLGSSLAQGGAINAAANTATAATKTFTFSGLLNGASKTLGVINQAIPVIYQVKPIWNNAKTMFRVMKAVNQKDFDDTSKKETTISNSSNEPDNLTDNSNNAPTFFA